MLKIYFFLKPDKTDQNNECPIYCRIKYRGRTVSISTGKRISKERWITTGHLRLPTNVKKEKTTKALLESFSNLIETKFNELVKTNTDTTVYDLKNEVIGKTDSNLEKGIIKLAHVHHKHFKRQVEHQERSVDTLQKFERISELLLTFLTIYYNCNDINVSKITSGFIYKFESYLRYESIYKSKVGMSNNSAVKYIQMLKTICNFCIKLDLIAINPFTKYDGRLIIKDVEFLLEDELYRIMKTDLKNKHLDIARDIFIFSCFTGYAPVDALNLTTNNIAKDPDNNLWIKTYRQKSKTRANVPLLPPAIRIIDKYKSDDGRLLPKMSNQKVNLHLKEIAKICKINKHLKHYTSRHTFGTTVTLGNGLKIENVSAMLGHTNIPQTQHYSKTLDKNVAEDMRKLIKKYS